MSHNPLAVIHLDEIGRIECFSYKALKNTLASLDGLPIDNIAISGPPPNIQIEDFVKNINPAPTPLNMRPGAALHPMNFCDAPLETSEACARQYEPHDPGANPFSQLNPIGQCGQPIPQSFPITDESGRVIGAALQMPPHVTGARIKNGRVVGIQVASGGSGYPSPYQTNPTITKAAPMAPANFDWALGIAAQCWCYKGLTAHKTLDADLAHGFATKLLEILESPAALERSELYRMRMAGISTAALGYFKGCADLYETPAIKDVAELYKKYDVSSGLLREAGYRYDVTADIWYKPQQDAMDKLASAYEQQEHRQLESGYRHALEEIQKLRSMNQNQARELTKLIDLARKHGWKDGDPIDEISKWLDSFVQVNNLYQQQKEEIQNVARKFNPLMQG